MSLRIVARSPRRVAHEAVSKLRLIKAGSRKHTFGHRFLGELNRMEFPFSCFKHVAVNYSLCMQDFGHNFCTLPYTSVRHNVLNKIRMERQMENLVDLNWLGKL
jgi:hypothetical protein